MTSITASVLTVRPVAPAQIPHWTGLATRAWFLGLVRQFDPGLAAAVHDHDGPKPYTVSGILGLGRLRRERPRLHPDYDYRLRITTLQSDLSELVRERLLSELQGQIIEIAGAKLRIEAVETAEDRWTGQTTDAELVQTWTLQTERLPKHIELVFDSPTAFRQQGVTVPFPLPNLVFGSLIDRWNAFNEVQLHPETRKFAEECVVASKYQLETKFVKFEGAQQLPVTGCVGSCRYVIVRGDRYWRGLVHALAAYSMYAGVGVHSTIGLGHVWLKAGAQNEDEI